MSTYLEIQEQIKKLQAQAEELRKAEIDAVINEIKAKINQYGITAKDLGFSATTTAGKKSSTEKAVVKYKKGDETWSGATRGRKPLWVKEILDAGGDIEQYRVPE